METTTKAKPPTPRRRAAIAAEVRAELARQSMTLTALSLSTHITVPTLRNRLAGKRPFFLEELDTICAALGVGLTELIDRTEVDG